MIASLYQGTFSVGINGRFIPMKADAKPERNTLKLAVNPFLIHNNGFTALIDAGLGLFGPLDHYDLMIKNLKKHSLKPEDIQHVYCSHLHTDHIGGLLHEHSGTYDLTFPEATIWLSGEDWERFKNNAENKGHEEALNWAHFLESHTDLQFVEDRTPEPGSIRMKTIGGHTRYHQAVLYDGEGEKAMMLGDVLARPEAINRSFKSKIDYDGEKSQEIRDEYLRKALEEDYLILTYHGDNGAMVRLKGYDQKKGYELESFAAGVAGQHS